MHDRSPVALDRRIARVQGWGDPPARATRLAERIEAELERRWNEPLPPRRARMRPVPATPSRTEGADVEALGRIVAVRTDDDARIACSLGKSYPDLLASRGESIARCCDAVLTPRSEDELAEAMTWLGEREWACVPVGGGTSVVGGIEPLARSGDQPVVAIDMSGLATCLDVDEIGRVATFQAGITGPDLESVLGRYGLTLGHVPQSFELSTLGGWIAARSAGQQSLAFGKIERMVCALDLHAPAGPVTVDHLPAHGAGPDPLDLLCGSEGTFGVISRATVRLQRRPTRVGFSSWLFPSFEEATDAVRMLVQRGIRPATVRVSDADETAFTLASSTPGFVSRSLARRVAAAFGLHRPSLALVVMPATRRTLHGIERSVARHMRGRGAKPLGALPARKWYEARFVQPYVRDRLIDRGLVCDTLETAAPWRSIDGLHRDVGSALTATLGSRAMVGCHLSHLYRDGASLYFTFIARCDHGAEFDVWQRAKRAVHEAIVRNRGATSHQHGVGTMHADLYRELTPRLVLESLQAARRTFDPAGIMNPGKLMDVPFDRAAALNVPAAG